MSGGGWSWPEIGEETRARRENLRDMAMNRDQLLRGMKVDSRIVDFVWIAAPARLESLVLGDLTDVSWLDELVVGEDLHVVPLLNLETWERGIVSRMGELYEHDEYAMVPTELWTVWEQVLQPGLEKLSAELGAGGPVPELLRNDVGELDVDGLLREAWLLGGPALVDFAEPYLTPFSPR